jgi:hypothetical protein
VPSTLHQCLIQWIGDKVEVVTAEDPVCVATTKARMDTPDGNIVCLSERDLTMYDYIRVSQDGLVLVSVKPMNVTRLNS